MGHGPPWLSEGSGECPRGKTHLVPVFPGDTCHDLKVSEVIVSQMLYRRRSCSVVEEVK